MCCVSHFKLIKILSLYKIWPNPIQVRFINIISTLISLCKIDGNKVFTVGKTSGQHIIIVTYIFSRESLQSLMMDRLLCILVLKWHNPLFLYAGPRDVDDRRALQNHNS